jgi:hypothetical protein
MFPVSNCIQARGFAMARAIRILQNRRSRWMLRHFDSAGASRSGIGQTRWGAVVHVQRGPADAVHVIQIF